MTYENTLELLDNLSKILKDLSIDSKYINAIAKSKNAIKLLNQKRKDEEKLIENLIEELKRRIRTCVYWACNGWIIEKHVISSIKYEIYNGDFYSEYNGQMVIKIYTDNDTGFYIYNDLGKTIFFSKKEAEKSLLD